MLSHTLSFCVVTFTITHVNCQVTTCSIGFLGPNCEVERPNLAQGKPTQQSSTSHNGLSSKAVDGDRNNVYSGGSCTHTDQWGAPDKDWWFVDLEAEHSVGYVRITTRDGYQSSGPMYDYTIKIGTQDPSVEANRDNAQVCATILTASDRPPAGVPNDFVCDPPIKGRYVICELNQVHAGWWFNFCEIEVYRGNNCEQDSSNFCFNEAKCRDFGGITCECNGDHFGQNCRYDDHIMDDYLCMKEAYNANGIVEETLVNIGKKQCAFKVVNGPDAAVYNSDNRSCTLLRSPNSLVHSNNNVLYWKNYKYGSAQPSNCSHLP